MLRFYECSEDELLNLPVTRFWNKHTNMEIIKIQERLVQISNVNISSSSYGEKEVDKLKFRLQQLTKINKPADSLKDIKARQPKLKETSKELDDIRAMLNDQRRKARKNKC